MKLIQCPTNGYAVCKQPIAGHLRCIVVWEQSIERAKENRKTALSYKHLEEFVPRWDKIIADAEKWIVAHKYAISMLKGAKWRIKMWKNWVLDVTHGHDPMAFCPIEDDGTIISGMTMISGKCPGRFVGIVHFDGDDAANAWLTEHSAIVDELAAANSGIKTSREAAFADQLNKERSDAV